MWPDHPTEHTDETASSASARWLAVGSEPIERAASEIAERGSIAVTACAQIVHNWAFTG